MQKYILLSALCFLTVSMANIDIKKPIKQKTELEVWANLAIKEHKTYNVLPSIKLGQLLLESSKEGKLGKSAIAKDLNNLFGIKWTGNPKLDWPAIGYEVRKEGKTCKYKTRFDSFRHHSLKLQAVRYVKVLNSSCYKTQAKELQKAYYAEDNNYAKKLIKIIETKKLYQYDI